MHEKAGEGGYFLDANRDFEKLYAAYPRKEARELARTVWHKLAREGRLPALSELLAAVDRFRASEGWQKEHGRFIPQLVNWLRGQRWLDPLPAVETDPVSPDGLTPARRTAAMLAALEKHNPDPALAALKPLFEDFAAKFRDGIKMHGPAFGLWSLLHKKGKAPLASDVQYNKHDNIMSFLKNYEWKIAEERRCA